MAVSQRYHQALFLIKNSNICLENILIIAISFIVSVSLSRFYRTFKFKKNSFQIVKLGYLYLYCSATGLKGFVLNLECISLNEGSLEFKLIVPLTLCLETKFFPIKFNPLNLEF